MAEAPPQAAPAATEKVPARIGRYEVLAPLSTGGMAEVYLAYTAGPAGFRKFVALKKILSNARRDEDAVRMFIDEARLTAGMSHSNIAQVYDLGEEHGELYIAMEFIPGLDLSRVARSCKRRGLRLPVGLVGLVVREVCLALHYAHHYQDPSGRSGGIIHRDVSPKNVMLTYSGNVKVIDFGIALALNRLAQVGQGAVRGTAAYMSPEQILGNKLGARTDIFSAGIVLHELLTGQRLFQGKTDVEVLQAVLGAPIPAPNEVNPRVPAELSAVAMRALHRDPERRFATAKEMAKAVEAAAGAMIFDDERAGAFMSELFAERLSHTRALLDLAAPEGDEGQLRSAAAELGADSLRLGGATAEVPALPALDEAEEPVTQTQTQDLRERPRRPRRILAVDDDVVMTTYLRMSLGPYGYEVVGCNSSSQVHEAIHREQPDLILLDVRMPEKDGYQVCQEIRERKDERYVPIVFLSAACSLDERVKGLTVGADDFVKKPFEPEELAARIRAHIGRVATLRAQGAAQPQPAL